MAFNVEKRFPRKNPSERVPKKKKEAFLEPEPLTDIQKEELDALSNVPDEKTVGFADTVADSLGWSTPAQEVESMKDLRRAKHQRGRELRFAEEAYMATRARSKAEAPARAARMEAEEQKRVETREEVLKRLHTKQAKEAQLQNMRTALEAEIDSLKKNGDAASVIKANALAAELKKLDTVLMNDFLNPGRRNVRAASEVLPQEQAAEGEAEVMSPDMVQPERSQVSAAEARAARMRELTSQWSSSREMTDPEKKQIRQELKQLMEEEFPTKKAQQATPAAFEYDEAPAFIEAGQFLDDTETSLKMTPPKGLSADEQIAMAKRFSPEDAARLYQGGAPVSEHGEAVVPTDNEPVPAPETNILDKEGVMVMANSVLTRQALGVKKSTDKKLDPFKPFPAVPASAAVSAPKPRVAPIPLIKKEGKKKWFIGGGALAGVAALAAAFLGFNSRKEEAPVGREQQTRPPIVESGITKFTTLSSTDAPPMQVIPLSALSVPGAPAERPVAVESVPKAAERVTTYPTVRRHQSLTPKEFAAWDAQFNRWMKSEYPTGYVAEDAAKVRARMVKQLGYPRGKQAERVVPAEKQQPAEKQPVVPTVPSESPRKRTVEDTYTLGS